ncbi:hypothetical protein NM208_g1493 [Fusarium decemcellulare]|uniref:Uncharacterized protein n=1 Tax=Fusarium decemcellulare TaxID=57161 RepID=A0ACC1SW43_9HYPO|nr:hypothetical protein NM208_g1493 [Fusarium decemcellulare]
MERQSYELLRWGPPTGVENKQKGDESAWPPEPRPLSKSVWASLSSVALFLPLLLLPIPFAVLLVLMSRLNGQPLSQHGASVFQGMGLASTLWPIAFAAILGSLARTVALYKAEKGTNLGTLGVLLGSQTLMSTLINAFTLRILSLWVILLLILWSLSPLGGQAVLRAVRVTSNAKAQDYDLMYSPTVDMGIPYRNSLWSSVSGLVSLTSTMVPMFGAALCAPNALGQAANGTSELFDESMRQIGGTGTASLLARTDLWGNVRVPQVTSLPRYSSSKPHEWVDVPTDQLVTYESLIGIPLRGLPFGSPGNLTLRLSANYITLECSPWFNTTEWLWAAPGVLRYHRLEDISTVMEKNGTYDMAQVYMDAANPTSGFNFSAKNITSKGPITRGALVFGTMYNSTVCDISHAYVDVDVACERVSGHDRMACRANRVRHSPSRPLSKPDDQLIPAFGHGPAQFIAGIPFLAPSSRPGLKSPMESYLADPAKGIGRFVEAGTDYITDEYTKLPLPVFAERLAIVINTALRVSWSAYAVLNFEAVNVAQEADRYGNTTGQFTSTTEVYETQRAWMATSILSLAIMFSAAILTVGLRLTIRAPDFLTHVAALTRDSKCMDVTPGGSTLSGDERARLLKDLPLKIMDIEPDDAVGMLAAGYPYAIFGVCLIVSVAAADDGDDFSNNLFTDLAPVLALFGERVTMQFMSQAMGWADHIILAMAPLGRARESRAIPEAELMSSTSNEVCELWNGHEIVRVMGKGPIREFIILLPPPKEEGVGLDLKSKGSASPESIQEVKAMELGKPTFRENLMGTIGNKPGDLEQPGHHDDRAIIILRNKTIDAPNLTLNVHTRFDRSEHYMAAIWGILLQLGVLLYFGFATYYPTLMLEKGGSRVESYAFACTAAGILCLAAGMMLCSYVVESSTEEKRYRPRGGREARLVWIQKSGTVSDQAFDSFAIFPTNPREMIITSRRIDMRRKSEAIIATIVCLGGFVVQFVGLRGMHWSAPVVQLGATVVMAIVRACVRRNLGQLPESRHLVSGFELDWLALTLSMEPTEAPWSGKPGQKFKSLEMLKRPWAQKGWDWVISGIQDPAMCSALKSDPSTVPERDRPASSSTDNTRESRRANLPRGVIEHNIPAEESQSYPINMESKTGMADRVLQIRRELGRLADWPGVASTEAVRLARAIEITMDMLDPLFELGDHTHKMSWSVQVCTEPVHFHLERTASGSWKTLADELEAALSLWLYYTDGEVERTKQRGANPQSGRPDKYDDTWLRAKGVTKTPTLTLLGASSPGLQQDLKWWMPDGAARTINVEQFKSTFKGSMVPTVTTHGKISGEIQIHRIVGFMSSHDDLSSEHGSLSGTDDSRASTPTATTNEGRKGTLAVESFSPLPGLFSRYMFSTFMWTVAKSLKQPIPGQVDVTPLLADGGGSTWTSFALHNTQLSRLVQCIQSTEIGTLEEVYQSIIPPLSVANRLPEPDAIIHLVRQHCQPHEQLGHWEEVAEAYIWLFNISNNFPEGATITLKATALLMEYLGEVADALKVATDQLVADKTIQDLTILKKRLTNRLKTADQGTIYQLQSLCQTQWRSWETEFALHAPPLESPNRCLQLTDLHLLAGKARFGDTLEGELRTNKNLNSRDIFDWTPLHHAASRGNPRTLKTLLKFRPDLNVQDIRGRTPLHIICWRWYGADPMRLLLQKGPDINIRDTNGRTPLHHATERGHKEVVESLIDARADVNIADNQGNTPLLWAAYRGYYDLVENLWSDAHKILRNHNGRTPLHLAAIGAMDNDDPDTAQPGKPRVNKAKVVRALMQFDPDKEAKDVFGDTPLHGAVRSGNLFATLELLDLGANIEAKSSLGYRPLYMAAERGHKSIVDHLLERGALIEGGYGEEFTYVPLHAAAKGGRDEAVRLLLDRGADIHNMRSIASYEKTALHYAAEQGHETVVRLLLEKGADTEFKDSSGNRPMHYAATKGHREVIQVLLDFQADLDGLDSSGCTALSIAARKGSMKVVELLLEKGARTEVEEMVDKRPLYQAAQRGNSGMVKKLLNSGALVDGSEDGQTSTPLHAASRKGNLAMALLLLRSGANENCQDEGGRTPLFYAAAEGHVKLVEQLLDAGSNADIFNHSKEAPIHMAALHGHHRVVQLLLQRGGNIEARGKFDSTPLHCAAEAGRELVVKLLLDQGAMIDSMDEDRRTPLSLAVEHNKRAVVQILLDRGAGREVVDDEGQGQGAERLGRT